MRTVFINRVRRAGAVAALLLTPLCTLAWPFNSESNLIDLTPVLANNYFAGESGIFSLSAGTNTSLLARTVSLDDGGTYNLYVNAATPELDIGTGQAPIWQCQLSRMASIYLTPTNSTNIIPQNQAVGSGLARALATFVLRSSAQSVQFSYREYWKDGALIYAEPLFRPGVLEISFIGFDRSARKDQYHDFLLAGTGLRNLPLDHVFIPVQIGSSPDGNVVAEKLNDADTKGLASDLNALLKAYKPELEALNVPVTLGDGLTDLGTFDKTGDTELIQRLSTYALSPSPDARVSYDVLQLLAKFKQRHPTAAANLATTARWGSFGLYLVNDIIDVHEKAAAEMVLRSYLNTSRDAQDRVAIFQAAYTHMATVAPGFDPALGDAIGEMESDITNQLTAVQAHVGAYLSSHTLLDYAQLILNVDSVTSGKLFSVGGKLGEKLFSTVNKNHGNSFGNRYENTTAGTSLAVADAVVTFLSRLEDKINYHREYSCLHTIFEMVRLYERDVALGRLNTSPALCADYYRDYKTADLLRQYYAYVLIQSYLEYYAAPGVFDWGQMSVDLAIGVVQAPVTAGWSAVGPVSAFGDELVTQIFAFLNSDDLLYLNSLGTNILNNMTEDISYTTNCHEVLESLYLAQSPQSIPVHNYTPPASLAIIPIPQQTVVVGETVSMPIQLSGLLPSDTANITFSGVANGSGSTILFTPLAGNVGSTNIHISASSGWSGSANFTLNLTVLATAPPTNLPPNTPSNLSPANWVANVSLTPLLVGSTFSDPDVGDVQAASRWIIRRALDNVRVFDSGTDAVNKMQLQVPVGILNHGTEYVWQVRHQDQQGEWSSYSYSTRFTTAVAAPLMATALFDGNFGIRVNGLTGEGSLYIFLSTNLVSWDRVFTNPPTTGSLNWFDRMNTNLPAAFYAPLQMIGTGAPPPSPRP